MLKLSRRKSERVIITIPGIGIGYVSVEKVASNSVMMGFDFPSSVGIQLDRRPRQADETSSAQDRASFQDASAEVR